MIRYSMAQERTEEENKEESDDNRLRNNRVLINNVTHSTQRESNTNSSKLFDYVRSKVNKDVMFYVYMAVIYLVDIDSIDIEMRTFIFVLSFIQLHLFREYVNSGPPASKTVLNGVIWTMSVGYQILLCQCYAVRMVSDIFPNASQAFVEQHLEIAAFLASSTWYSILIILGGLYIGAFKLLTAVRPNAFLTLDHEFLSKMLNACSLFLTFAMMCVKFFVDGGFGHDESAILLLKHIGKLEFAGVDVTKDWSYDKAINVVLMVISVGLGIIAAVIEQVKSNTHSRWSFKGFRRMNQTQQSTCSRAPELDNVDAEGQNATLKKFVYPFSITFLLSVVVLAFDIYLDRDMKHLLYNFVEKSVLEILAMYLIVKVDKIYEFALRRVKSFIFI